MSILNSLPKAINIATETSNGLMSFEDKIAVNKINKMEADIATKMNKDKKITSSQLDTSSDTVKIHAVNLGEDVKKMMTGQEPISPYIKSGSIVTEYMANNSVTSTKRTPVGSFALIISDDFCNFDTTGDTEVILSIPKKYIVYYGAESLIAENVPVTLTLQKGVPSIIAFDKWNKFITYNDTEMHEDDYLLGAFDGTNVVMFNGRYTVNGHTMIGNNSVHGSSIEDFTLDSRKIAIQHGMIVSDKTEAPFMNVNFTNNFVEVIKEFNINIADQYILAIKRNHECKIPENTYDKKFLYVYYDLGSDKLNAMWSSNDITKTILNNNEKLVLLGIISNNKIAVGLNNEFISIDSVSLKNKDIEYANIFSGKIIVDFKNKKITGNNITSFIDDKFIDLTEIGSQNIILNDDIITNIISSGIPYTIGAVRLDFNSDKYKLVFKKTEEIKSLGLDAIYLATIKKYDVSNNNENIIIIKQDGNIVKSNNIISSGQIVPMDNETIIVELTTDIIDGNLTLSAKTIPGISIIDPSSNIEYEITKEQTYSTIVNNLHGVYSVIFNTENNRIEIVPTANIDNNKIYIALGYVKELSDSLAYTATDNIVNHITLNNNRPSNYAIIDGPDPDKGYDWSKNRLILPKDIYLMANSHYSVYCQNMSMNKYIDNDYILYEIGLPQSSILTENTLDLYSPVSGEFETRIVGKFKGNNSCLYKDLNIHFEQPEGKELSVLCIGDDTVAMNMPSYIKEYLTQLGYTPSMLGTTKNTIDLYGYGMKNLSEEYGEGHNGWRLTDFMCKTQRIDSSIYYVENNPFMNDQRFDFSHYMNTNSYDKVDVVVISVGMNDITGYHTASSIEKIEKLSINQNMEQLPTIYKEMIASIHEFDDNIKIIINPTMIKGTDDNYNRKSLQLTETLLYDLKDIQNIFFVPGYIGQPLFVAANKTSTENYNTYNDINDTKIGSSISSFEINGIAQSNLAYLISSAIVCVTK